MNHKTKELLTEYAVKYETADFLTGDPSWFMHQVEGPHNQEVVALIASCLSYGNRKLFMPKILLFLKESRGISIHGSRTIHLQWQFPIHRNDFTDYRPIIMFTNSYWEYKIS